MNLKVGDSVLYLSPRNSDKHTGIITDIDSDKSNNFPYKVHWINDQDSSEPWDEMQEYRKNYIEALDK